MVEIQSTPEFSDWLPKLRDARAKAKIFVRIDRLAAGNPGDVSPVGDGISEMRIHYGPGYRIYYAQRDKVLVILLCGGDKRSQDKDIKRAKKLALELDQP